MGYETKPGTTGNKEVREAFFFLRHHREKKKETCLDTCIAFFQFNMDMSSYISGLLYDALAIKFLRLDELSMVELARKRRIVSCRARWWTY